MLAAWRRIQSTRPPLHLISSQILQYIDSTNHIPHIKDTTVAHSYDQITSLKDHSQIRCVFSLPGFDDQIAKKYNERKLLGYSPQQLYDVVADVDNYSLFVPWCQGSTVLRRDGDRYLEAELQVGFQVFIEKYISRVTLEPYSSITSRVGESTLFSHLYSEWKFQQGPTPQSVWLSFTVDFAFKSPLYRQVASLFFEEVVQKMMRAFEGRCHTLYGKSSLQRRAIVENSSSGGGSSSTSSSSS